MQFRWFQIKGIVGIAIHPNERRYDNTETRQKIEPAR